MEDQEFINQLAEKLSKLGTVRPLGFHYLHPYGTVPADSIICNGATYSRALYKDFFDYITTQGWVKTEAEWQEIAERDNGFCPFYSDGDGSTNFRTPKFAPYQQIAMKVATAIRFKASDYSPVYGRTNTVQPESHEWVMCVVAYGIATNVGSVDIQNVMSATAQVQAKIASIQQAIGNITKFAAPAYASGSTIAANTTVTIQSNGFLRYRIKLAGSGGKSRTITINGVDIEVNADDWSTDQSILPVLKGDSVRHNGVDELMFYPARYGA